MGARFCSTGIVAQGVGAVCRAEEPVGCGLLGNSRTMPLGWPCRWIVAQILISVRNACVVKCPLGPCREQAEGVAHSANGPAKIAVVSQIGPGPACYISRNGPDSDPANPSTSAPGEHPDHHAYIRWASRPRPSGCLFQHDGRLPLDLPQPFARSSRWGTKRPEIMVMRQPTPSIKHHPLPRLIYPSYH